METVGWPGTALALELLPYNEHLVCSGGPSMRALRKRFKMWLRLGPEKVLW